MTKSLKDEWTSGPLRFVMSNDDANGHRILAVGTTEDGGVRRLEV